MLPEANFGTSGEHVVVQLTIKGPYSPFVQRVGTCQLDTFIMGRVLFPRQFQLEGSFNEDEPLAPILDAFRAGRETDEQGVPVLIS